MSIASMTGFGRSIVENGDYVVTVEIKSVNNRYKDFRFKLPTTLNRLEFDLKKELNESFKRGSFDVSINIKRVEGKNRFDDLDSAKIEAFLEKMTAIADSKKIPYQIDLTQFLRTEFYRDESGDDENQFLNLALKAFQSAILELKISRKDEGQKLSNVLLGHLDDFTKAFSTIEKNAGLFKDMVKERLIKRVSEFQEQIKIDEGRLLQEVVFYLEKIDVHEEINRIHAHLEKLQNLLKSKDEVGRQIDFIIQELNRETNTIGSKSSMKEISDAVVFMKVQLEKMREQGLNLE
jgi:uncharacterized protein (TIGR00255 family)